MGFRQCNTCQQVRDKSEFPEGSPFTCSSCANGGTTSGAASPSTTTGTLTAPVTRAAPVSLNKLNAENVARNRYDVTANQSPASPTARAVSSTPGALRQQSPPKVVVGSPGSGSPVGRQSPVGATRVASPTGRAPAAGWQSPPRVVVGSPGSESPVGRQSPVGATRVASPTGRAPAAGWQSPARYSPVTRGAPASPMGAQAAATRGYSPVTRGQPATGTTGAAPAAKPAAGSGGATAGAWPVPGARAAPANVPAAGVTAQVAGQTGVPTPAPAKKAPKKVGFAVPAPARPAPPPVGQSGPSPKWSLPKERLQRELRRGMEAFEANFDAICSGRPIAFHEFAKRTHEIVWKKATSTPAPLCDACGARESEFKGDTQLWPKAYMCALCRDADVGSKKSNGQYGMICAKRCFDTTDVNHNQSLDFLEFIHFIYELCPQIDLVPQKALMIFIREAFQKFQQPSLKSGKREMPLAGVQAFFDTCFKARAPNLEEVYHNLAKPDGEFPIWKFLRLLVTVFYPNCKHNQVQDPGQKLTRPMAAAPMISFRKLPKSAKSFRGLIPKQTFDISKLKRVKILGKGGNCAAWLCKYEGVGEVVAKIPLEKATPEEVKKMMQAARQQMLFDHECILRVLGVFENEQPPTILLELAEGGDVSDLFAGHVDKPTQWRLCKEVAEGLECLHTYSPFPYAHRDLKGMNVFLTKDLHAKVADFDFLIEIPQGCVVTGLCGTPGYIAPEMLTGEGYDHTIDTWSYGSLLYEITHATFPYSKEVVDDDGRPLPADDWTARVLELTVGGMRPVVNTKTTPPRMVALIQDCWSADPAKRPSMGDIIKRLDDMEEDFDED